MINKLAAGEFKSIVGSENALENEPMNRHCTFRVGGSASLFVSPVSTEQVCRLIKAAKETQTPYFVVGNGSNILVSDSGYDGMIINIGKNLSAITVDGCTIRAEAGASLAAVANAAARHGLSGLEFASGIPGTVGGAVYMNAGAYGGEMKDVVERTEYASSDGRMGEMSGDAHKFSYRKSVFSDNGCVILSAVFRLEKGNPAEIKERMDDYNGRRRAKQPLEYPSAGSTFKRPDGFFAGKLIEDAGLKGFSIGGASVSAKHSGFVINSGEATCDDIKGLIEHIQKTVYEKYGVMLEPEVKFLG